MKSSLHSHLPWIDEKLCDLKKGRIYTIYTANCASRGIHMKRASCEFHVKFHTKFTRNRVKWIFQREYHTIACISFHLKYYKTLKIHIPDLIWEHTTYHQHISHCCYSFVDRVLPWHLPLRPPHWSSSPADTYSPPPALNLLSLPRLNHQISKQKSWDVHTQIQQRS